MDFQTIINLVAGTVLAVMGWLARELWGAVSELRSDISKLREELPKTYATKNDVKDGVHELKQLLVAIDAKLDRKADK